LTQSEPGTIFSELFQVPV